jgi:RNA-directed DNA polymerase
MRHVLNASSRGSAEWIGEATSSAILDRAFAWLCKRRIDYADSADVWNVRRQWPDLKAQLQHALLNGQYRFQPLRRIEIQGEFRELWAALDALALKALAIVLSRRLDFPRSCYHLPVRHICSRLPSNRFVFRSDVKSYYASIDHAAASSGSPAP